MEPSKGLEPGRVSKSSDDQARKIDVDVVLRNCRICVQGSGPWLPQGVTLETPFFFLFCQPDR
jgi:hypothetical protein